MKLTERQLLDNKKLCLEQLRLSKYQLVWNKEHEIKALDIDRSSLSKLELSGKGEPQQVAGLRQNIETREATARAEIRYAQSEIEMLDTEIAEVEKELAKPIEITL